MTTTAKPHRPGHSVKGAMLCSALALVLASCNARAPEQSAAPTAEAARAAPQATAPQPQATAPQWPRAETIHAQARAGLPSPAAGRLEQSPVPVLVPNDSQILQRAEAVVLADQYTLTSTVDDATVSIQASPAKAAGRGERSLEVKRTPVGNRAVFFTQNEEIRVATWIENGVSYSAEVECARDDDPKCRDYSYLQSIVEKLVFVGGRGARQP